jgi:hypothetical protein
MGNKYWSTAKMNGVINSSTVDATYRVWVNDLHAALLEVGLVVDTVSAASHMNLATAACPLHDVRTNFIVYELNDALSATLPIYIKIAYGGLKTAAASPTVAAFPNCWVQIGTTVTAGGVIGGIATDQFSAATAGTSTGSILSLSGPNILSKEQGFLFFAASSNSVSGRHPIGCISFALERLPDTIGNLTADGYTVVTPTPMEIIVGTAQATTAQVRTMTATFDTGWQVNPCVCNGGASSATDNGAVQFHKFYHGTDSMMPFRGLFGYFATALPTGGVLSLPVAGGGSMRYRALGGGSVNEYYFRADIGEPGFGVACLWG